MTTHLLFASNGLDREIERALAGGPKTAAQLTAALGISQPTLSIRVMPQTVTSFRVTGQRTPLYALLRQLPMGLNPRQRIHRYLGKDWRDEHRGAYLFTQGLNLPGNLVFGDVSLQKEMELRTAAPIPAAEKLTHYVAMASRLQAAA